MLADLSSSKVRIGLLEIKLSPHEEISARIKIALQLLTNIEPDVFDLIILPELWIAGAFNYEGNSGLNQDNVRNFLNDVGNLAVEKNLYIHSGTHPLINSSGYLSNTAVIFNNLGKVVCSYEKIHLFGFEDGERSIFTEGKVIGLFNFMNIKVGVSTCYDLRFPELYISQVNLGAEIMLVSAAWPEKRIQHWRQLLIARAIESQAYVIGCNASGSSAGITLGSHSMVIDPFGNELHLELINGIQKCELDLNELEQYRSSFPVLRDRVSLL